MSEPITNQQDTSRTPLVAPTFVNRIGCLVLAFLVMIITVGLSKVFTDYLCAGSERNAFLISSILQNVLAFMFPAWLTAFLCSDNTARYLGLSQPVRCRQFIGVIILLLLISPAMDYIVDWSEKVRLPECMHSFEEMMRRWEDTAADTTRMILGDSSIWGLISGIAIVGLLTGFGEEMLFRAGIQKAMTASGVNGHIAIWTTAVIFSAVHFQFFGFVPRVLLGAVFGYLYLYTGSLYVSSWAHALNNSVVVLSSWLTARGVTTVGFERALDFDGSLWAVFASVLLSFIYIYRFGRRVFSSPAHN